MWCNDEVWCADGDECERMARELEEFFVIPAATRTGPPQVIVSLQADDDADEDTPQCRICLESGPKKSSSKGEEYPSVLVSPCACRGASRHVHIQCLREWAQRGRGQASDRTCPTCHVDYFGVAAVALASDTLTRAEARVAGLNTARGRMGAVFQSTRARGPQRDVSNAHANLARVLMVRARTQACLGPRV